MYKEGIWVEFGYFFKLKDIVESMGVIVIIGGRVYIGRIDLRGFMGLVGYYELR